MINYFKFILICFMIFPITQVQAETFGGIEFPDGEKSFADEIVSFTVGSFASSPYTTSDKALGVPNPDGDVSNYCVSLGNNGILILKFSNNSLTTSGNSDLDLWIFEGGPAVEKMQVFISTDNLRWISVGSVSGSTSGVDIDAFIGNGVVLGGRYSYVKLIDDEIDNYQEGPFAGADVDAVGAISSDIPVPECQFVDSDGDGVIDQWDSCPKTPENSCVNNKGCSCEKSVINENGTVEKGKWKTYYANINNSYSNFIVKIQNLTDDVDLYVKKDNKPDFNNYECRPYKGGKRDEVCDLTNSGDTLWYFSIYGYKSGDFTISVKAKR